MTGQPQSPREVQRAEYQFDNAEAMSEKDPMLQAEPELNLNVKRHTLKVKTVASVLLKTILVTGVLSGAYFAATKFGVTEGDHVDVLNNAFVNYVGTVPSIPIPHHAADKSRQIRFEVCNPELVALTCGTLNNETEESHNNALDARLDVVHVIEISEALMVQKSLVVELLEKLKNDPKVRLPMIRDIAGGEKAVVCMDLCRALVASFPPLEVSTYSDVGCYLNPRDTTRIECDINLSPRKVEDDIESGGVPAGTQEVAFGEEVAMKNFDRPDPAEKAEMQYIESRLGHMLTSSHDHEIDKLDNVDLDELKMMLINRFRIWPVTKTVVERGRAATAQSEPPAPQLTGRRMTPTGDWRKDTLRLGLEAKANIVLALTAMNSRKINTTVDHWFGNNDENPTRSEIKRVLAGVHNLLNNVDFVYPGSHCGPNTYAYVFAQSPWNRNKQGKYLFYLCDTYMNVNDGEKIETLVHEGSHHQVQLAKDSHWPSKSGKTMYGRQFCENVAADCKGNKAAGVASNKEACVQSLRNADTYCYFVNDAARAAVGKLNAWDTVAFVAGVDWTGIDGRGGSSFSNSFR